MLFRSLIESFHISPSLPGYFTFFECGIEFYYDFEINIYKFIDDVGITKIFSHRYNDSGKLVKFNLVTDNLDEAHIWNLKVLEYQKIHNCKALVISKFDEINKQYPSYYESYNASPYKIYNIGRFPKVSKDFKSADPRTFGYLHFGYWKTSWSYQHPKSWTSLSSEEIANDILGL